MIEASVQLFDTILDDPNAGQDGSMISITTLSNLLGTEYLYL